MAVNNPSDTQQELQPTDDVTFNSVSLTTPLGVDDGGTGTTSLTDGGIILGSGTSSVTVTAQPTDGQLLIGSTGVDPVLATLTAGTGITINNSGGGVEIVADNNGTVTSVSGTADRITISGTAADPVVDIAATYVGQATITTLGTITTGTWNGTDIAVADGGTGRSSHTEYAVICGGTTATGAQQSIASVGTSGQVLTSNGAGALPTFQDAAGDVSGPGSSTDNALARWNGTGGDTLQDSTVLVSDNGEMTNASQPAFLAYLPSTQSNVTGDGTGYTLGGSGGTALTEVYDQNGDFATATFTAPVTGRYYLGVNFLLQGMVSGTNGTNHSLVTSNGTFTIGNDSGCFTGNNAYSYGQFVDMDAADTATVTITATGGTKIVDVFGDSGRRTNFYGWLVA